MISRQQSSADISNVTLKQILRAKQRNTLEKQEEFTNTHTLDGLLNGEYDGEKITIDNVIELVDEHNVNTVGKTYGSLLHLFVRRNEYVAIVALLIKCKKNNISIDLNIINHEGKTPLACLMNNHSGSFPDPRIGVLLIESGADEKTVDEDGNNLLHKLLECGCDSEIVEDLLKSAPSMMNLRDTRHKMKPFQCLKNYKYRTIESANDIKLITLGIRTYAFYAKRLIERGELKNAINLFSWALELFDINNPENDWELFQQILEHRGNAYKKIKEYDNAIENYTMLIESFPQYYNISQVYRFRAACYIHMKEIDKAYDDYNVILKNSEDKYALLDRAQLFFKENKIDDAMTDCKKSIALNLEEFSSWQILHRLHHIKCFILTGKIYFAQAQTETNITIRQEKFKLSFEHYVTANNIKNECIHSYEFDNEIKKIQAILEKNIRIFLTSNTDLSAIRKPAILEVIAKFSVNPKLDLLRECLIPERPLGNRLHFSENMIAYALRFFGCNPDRFETLKCNRTKGSLAKVITMIQDTQKESGEIIIDNEHSIALHSIKRSSSF